MLKAAGAASLGMLWTGAASGLNGFQDQPQSQPAETNPADAPWWRGPQFPRSRVVDIVSGRVLRASTPDKDILWEQLSQGLQALTRTNDLKQAWQTVLGDAKRIAIKFNSVAATVLDTTDVFTRVLMKGLGQAGYGPTKITLVEAPPYLAKQLGTRQPARGWGEAIAVGEELEQLANYLHEADAIINVPFLKTHQIAGMSCCLKNLSHALIRRPARYHANGCSPYVAQVIAAKEVHSRLKLNLVNALRIVVENGPEATEKDIHNEGRLLLGHDPVAVDSVGLELLADRRRQRGLSDNLTVAYLAAAEELGLGNRRPQWIEKVSNDMGR